jgi:NTP pyrophosphatase (non-canonical NTP hydrolase)
VWGGVPSAYPGAMADEFRRLRDEAVAFRDERDWKQFHAPKDLALGCAIEAAELAELFLWKKEGEVATAMGEPGFRERLSDEMADVLLFLLYLSDASGIDLPEAARAKLQKNAAKYPADRFRGSARKYDEPA